MSSYKLTWDILYIKSTTHILGVDISDNKHEIAKWVRLKHKYTSTAFVYIQSFRLLKENRAFY